LLRPPIGTFGNTACDGPWAAPRIPEPDGVTFAYTVNKMAPGSIGSDRADAYLTATFEAVR
ncbi:MAG TPA: hypothetical protein VL179_03525, partial [Mycobacterium sp.]|nr:hypothetical protein [Mycobacterium sp.]